MNSCFIRPARESDSSIIAACVHAAYLPWVSRLGKKPAPMLQDFAAVIAAERVFIAERDGRVVGVLVLSETTDGFLVDNVAVLPAYVRQGIGKRLLVHAEQQAKTHGYDSIHLYTNAQMLENIAMYARMGYVEYQRRQEQGFRRVFMRKVLG